MKTPDDLIEKLLGVPYDSLDELTKKVARHVSERKQWTLRLRSGEPCRTMSGLNVHPFDKALLSV